MFGGEVESLAVAEVEGVGVRVIVDAPAGLCVGRVARPRRHQPRRSPKHVTTRRSARLTRATALASPEDATGVDAPVLDLWRDDVLSVTTAKKVALALELEAATLAADPRVRGVESASYGDAAVEAAVANSLGLQAATRRTVCSCSAFAMAGEGTATQTGSGFSAGRSVR